MYLGKSIYVLQKGTDLVFVVEDGAQDRNQAHLFGEVFYAKKGFELLKRDYDGSTGHEPNKGSFWKKINYEAKSASTPNIKYQQITK